MCGGGSWGGEGGVHWCADGCGVGCVGARAVGGGWVWLRAVHRAQRLGVQVSGVGSSREGEGGGGGVVAALWEGWRGEGGGKGEGGRRREVGGWWADVPDGRL